MSRMSPSERFLPSWLVKAVVWVISSNVNSLLLNASHQRRRFIITHPESCLFVWNFRLDFFLRRRLSCIRYVPTYLRLSHAVGNMVLYEALHWWIWQLVESFSVRHFIASLISIASLYGYPYHMHTHPASTPTKLWATKMYRLMSCCSSSNEVDYT